MVSRDCSSTIAKGITLKYGKSTSKQCFIDKLASIHVCYS